MNPKTLKIFLYMAERFRLRGDYEKEAMILNYIIERQVNKKAPELCRQA